MARLVLRRGPRISSKKRGVHEVQKTPIALGAIALFSAAPFAAQAAPTVAFKAPAAGATISQPIYQSSQCEVTGLRIDRVAFSIRRSSTSTWTSLNTEENAPWQCNIDPSKFASGQYVLRAIARDSSGASATATRTINLGTTNTAPTVSITSPTGGQTVSGSSVSCGANAGDSNGIKQVQFFLDSATTAFATDSSSPYACSFDSTKLSNGSHTLKAIATDSLGAKKTAQVSFTVSNAANKAPSVSIMKPDANATITAPLNGSGCEASAADTDGSVKRVDFFLSKGGTSTPVGSKTAAPYQCAIDTAKFEDGSYTLMAVATDNQNAVASAQRALTISKPSSGGGSTSPINPADIITRASADLLFTQQNGYTAQVVNTYTSAPQIPESGIHGSTLPSGETLRLGKQTDPMNSVLKALSFQVQNSDPTTSSGKRAELAIQPNIEMNKVYWITFSAYVYDWGTLATTDNALFGVQCHTGDNTAAVGGPSFGIYTTQNGRMLRVQARYSESSTPSSSNAVSVKYAEHPIPFHRWADFVLKFKHNTSGNGFLQVWMDGEMIANHQGSLGYNTGMADYAKFGYYNWSGAAMGSNPRKVLLRAPTIVADPTGQTYSAEQVRTLLSPAAAQ